ncbi:MAG: WYL domain-containing protein [Treponema sp.]|nr:WYL domain-containing protein [Treponema sp.]
MKQNRNKSEHTLNKKMLERLIIIHNAIKAGMYPDVQKLQRLYCEQTGYEKVGEATINRDIDKLRTYFHAPLEFDKFRGGYYYSDSKWEFSLNSLSTNDVFYLSAAKTLLSRFEGSPMYDAISDVIDFVVNTQSVGKNDMLKRIAIPPAPRINVDDEIWKKLLEAVKGNMIVEFDYNGRWNPETSHRRVHPYQFLFDDGMVFIYGYSVERGEVRIFHLNRIRNLKLTGESFELPEDFDFSSHCGGGKFGVFITDDPTDFTVDFYGDARGMVKDRLWADDQKITDFDEEGKTRIQFSSTQFLAVKQWILSQGENAVPVEPEWFVEEWRKSVRKMGERVKQSSTL